MNDQYFFDWSELLTDSFLLWCKWTLPGSLARTISCMTTFNSFFNCAKLYSIRTHIFINGIEEIKNVPNIQTFCLMVRIYEYKQNVLSNGKNYTRKISKILKSQFEFLGKWSVNCIYYFNVQKALIPHWFNTSLIATVWMKRIIIKR